jgi:hypothetical protein
MQFSAKQTEGISLIYKYCKNSSKFIVQSAEISYPQGCYTVWAGKLLPTLER